MKVSVKSIIALTLASLFLSTAAVAGEREGRDARTFSEADRDVMRQQWFDRVDANNDGYISEQEFIDVAVLRAERRARSVFQRMDQHNKGEISMGELAELAEKRAQRGHAEGRKHWRQHKRQHSH